MSAEKHKELVRRYFNAFVSGSDEAFDEIMLPTFSVHGLHQKAETLADDARGPAMFKRAAAAWRMSFPDVRITIHEIVAEETLVMARWTVHATHLGEFAGLPARGQTLEYSGVNCFQVQHGKLAAGWDLWDRLLLWQQLGVLPSTPEFLAAAKASMAQ